MKPGNIVRTAGGDLYRVRRISKRGTSILARQYDRQRNRWLEPRWLIASGVEHVFKNKREIYA
jgi:hypothetical protein